MLHHRKYPYKVTKSYAFAAVAKAEGVNFIYFSPKTVDFEKNIINGYLYKNGTWISKEMNFPDVIYNAGSPEKLARSKDIVERLKKQIPFTTFSIGNKLNVFERLKKSGVFSEYLVPSKIINTVKDFFNYLETHQQVMLKPVLGHKGQDVILIRKRLEEYSVQIDQVEQGYDYSDLSEFVIDKIGKEPYLVQPYINCRTKSGSVYDLRLHVQKNGENKWVLTAAYPRIAQGCSVVSNISKGASTNYLEPFLKYEFGDEWFNIKRYLEEFALKLAINLDEIQKEYFSEAIDELGIDVGLDESRKIWIYEVNWRPGCPPTMYLELDVVKNMIRYAMYLAKKHNESL